MHELSIAESIAEASAHCRDCDQVFVLPDMFLLCTCGSADLDFECGPEGGADDFLEWFHKADRDELGPPVLVIEGAPRRDDRHTEGLTMGLGIPEQVIELVEGFGDQLAVVDVQARTARSTSACLRSRSHLADGC